MEPVAVLALIRRIMSQRIGDLLRLIHEPGANRSGVDFDQADEVGIQRLQVLRDAFEDARVAAQITGPGDRQVKGGPGTGRVPDVVQDKSHRERESGGAGGSQRGILSHTGGARRVSRHVRPGDTMRAILD